MTQTSLFEETQSEVKERAKADTKKNLKDQEAHDLFFETKRYVRRLEKTNNDRLYVVHRVGDTWWKMYDNSALFYRVLANETIELKKEKMLEPISDKEPQKFDLGIMKPIKIQPDKDGRYRAKYCATAHGEAGFLRRMEYIALKELPVPEQYKLCLRIYGLPHRFSQQDINGFYKEENMLLSHITHLVYGKNPDTELMKLSRKVMQQTCTLVRHSNRNEVLNEMMLKAAIELKVTFQHFARYAPENNKKAQFDLLRKMYGLVDYLLAYLDTAMDDRIFNTSEADDYAIQLSKLAEGLSIRMMKIDKSAMDMLGIYQDLRIP